LTGGFRIFTTRMSPPSRAPLERCLADVLARAGLVMENGILVVAVSGGADSVALLRGLCQVVEGPSQYLRIAHFNHGIRADADKDADFVRQLCHQLDLPLSIGSGDVPAAARMAHRSIEMQARLMRYTFLKSVAEQEHARAVLTAHTLDDQAETLLLNLCRGAGPAALRGIPPDTTVQGVRVVRPLLQVSRQAIEHYLHDLKQSWREDLSNLDTTYRRNAVRHRILPLLKDLLNPHTSEALSRAAECLRADHECLEMQVSQCEASIVTASQSLRLAPYRQQHLSSRRRLLSRWLRGSGIPPERIRFEWLEWIDQLAHVDHGGDRIQLCSGIEIQHRYDHLAYAVASPSAKGELPVALRIPGITELPGFGCRVEARFDTGFTRLPPSVPGHLPAEVHLHAPAVIAGGITVRSRLPGDRIDMLGMNGSKKVQDILTDAKIPGSRRDQIPVFMVEDKIAWIPGCRPARDCAVPSVTAPSLHLRVMPLGDEPKLDASGTGRLPELAGK